MEVWLTFVTYAVALIIVSLLGAYTPYIKNLSDKQVHLLISLSAGIFLGIMFFLLLPEAIHESSEGGYEEKIVMLVVLTGFLIILLADILIKRYHMVGCACEHHVEECRHKTGPMSAYIGLAVHAFMDGLILAAAIMANREVTVMALAGICLHKYVELFSLSSTFVISDKDKKTAMKYLLAFVFITPIGALISLVALNGMLVDGMVGLPLAFAAGTLMYVSFCHMIPEAFHREEQNIKSLATLLVGLVISAIVFLFVGHVH